LARGAKAGGLKAGTQAARVFQQKEGSAALVGRAAVSDFAKGYFEAYQTVWVKTSADVVSDDWAYERYTYKSVDTPRPDGPAAGTPVVTDTGNGINIYQRGADGKWRVARDAWATDKALIAN
jgi:ketosteroid isomerase-like protein